MFDLAQLPPRLPLGLPRVDDTCYQQVMAGHVLGENHIRRSQGFSGVNASVWPVLAQMGALSACQCDEDVRWLMERGADPLLRHNGETVLHWTVARPRCFTDSPRSPPSPIGRHAALARRLGLLVTHGANPLLVDRNGESALLVWLRTNRFDPGQDGANFSGLMGVLRADALLTKPNRFGESVLSVATARRQWGILAGFIEAFPAHSQAHGLLEQLASPGARFSREGLSRLEAMVLHGQLAPGRAAFSPRRL